MTVLLRVTTCQPFPLQPTHSYVPTLTEPTRAIDDKPLHKSYIKYTEFSIPALKAQENPIKYGHILTEEEEIFADEQNHFKNVGPLIPCAQLVSVGYLLLCV